MSRAPGDERARGCGAEAHHEQADRAVPRLACNVVQPEESDATHAAHHRPRADRHRVGGDRQATFPGVNGPIAFRQFDPATEQFPLLRALPDGTQVTELSDRPGFSSDWRADGGRVALDFFQRDGDEQIATMNPDGTDLRVITSGPGIHEIPSWSPNGRRIVFNYSRDLPDDPDFETRLWTMRANGSHPRRLAMRERGFDVEPRYSPNGDWIAFDRLRFPDDEDICVMNADGSNIVEVIDTPDTLENWPSWGPAPSS